jgi:hypothetical protein
MVSAQLGAAFTVVTGNGHCTVYCTVILFEDYPDEYILRNINETVSTNFEGSHILCQCVCPIHIFI